MEIHKPKAVHSWREFLTEIGTIVVGILIALSLEQVAEKFHEHRASSEAREAIRREISDDLAQLAISEREGPCGDRRLDEIDNLLDAASRGEPIPKPLWIGRPRILPMTTARWEAATASGRLSLLSSDEQSAYATVYTRLHSVEQHDDPQQEVWAKLRALEDATTLTPAMIDNYRILLHTARWERYRVKRQIARLFEAAASIGLKANPRSNLFGYRLQMASACIPMNTPADKANAMVGSEEPN